MLTRILEHAWSHLRMEAKQSWTWSALGWEDPSPTAVLPWLALSSGLVLLLAHLFQETSLNLATERASSLTSHLVSQPKTQALSLPSRSASEDGESHLSFSNMPVPTLSLPLDCS